MSDIIAAISTAPVPSGVGVIRLSGAGCAAVAARVLTACGGCPIPELPPRKLMLCDLHDRKGRVIDRILAVRTPGPHSYTGEDTMELQCHGSPAVLREAMAHLLEQGARQALAGEFTRRAFLNGQMDLTAAEAVIDLIDAETADAAANAAGQVGGALTRKLEPVYQALISVMSHFHAVLDYPDEDIDDFRLAEYSGLLKEQDALLRRLLSTCRRGSVITKGVKTVILGKPNAGKSSLLNALAGYERVIVTDIPGTTRDTVEEKLRLGDLLLRLVDTAGIRQSEDAVEALGVKRALTAAKEADLVLLVLDGSGPLTEEDRAAIGAAKEAPRCICILNKSDLGSALSPADLPFDRVVPMSAKDGTGIDALTSAAAGLFQDSTPCDGSILTNLRHENAIRAAAESIEAACASMELGETPDAVLMDVEAALESIGDLLGKTMREDITSDIFSRFCVGK